MSARSHTIADQLNLQEAEKQAFTSHLQSGLWEIFAGLILLALWVYTLTGADVAYAGLMGAAILSVSIIRRRVIQPRLGLANYTPRRRARLRWVAVSVAGFALVGLVVYLLTDPIGGDQTGASWLQLHGRQLVPAVLFLVFFGLLATLMDHPLFVLLGLLCAGGFTLRAITRSPWGFLVAAAIALTIGITMLVRFLQRYPRPAGEDDHGRA